MKQVYDFLKGTTNFNGFSKINAIDKIIAVASEAGYKIEEVNKEKPWGAYIRFSSADAEVFVREFFPSLDFAEAQLGREDVELSPKILLVASGQRLSWQYHYRSDGHFLPMVHLIKAVQTKRVSSFKQRQVMRFNFSPRNATGL